MRRFMLRARGRACVGDRRKAARRERRQSPRKGSRVAGGLGGMMRSRTWRGFNLSLNGGRYLGSKAQTRGILHVSKYQDLDRVVYVYPDRVRELHALICRREARGKRATARLPQKCRGGSSCSGMYEAKE